MRFDDVVLPEWFGVLGSAVIAAVITAVALPASPGDLGTSGSEQIAAQSSREPHSANRRDEPQR